MIGEAIDAVKRAIGSEGPFDHFHLADGQIEAGDREVAAGAPFPWGGTASVPAKEMERVFSSVTKGDIDVVDDRMTIKAGRFRASLPVLTSPPPRMERSSEPDVSIDLDERFKTTMAELLPFVSDQDNPPWISSVLFKDGLITVFSNSNRMMVWADDLWFKDAGTLLVPKRAIEQIVAMQFPPIAAEITGSRITFTWLSGAWFATSQIAGDPPLAMDKIRGQWKDPEWEISDVFRQSFERVSKFSSDTVVISDGKVSGTGDRADVEDESDAPTSSDLKFETWVVDMILKSAKMWEPSLFPSPFKGDTISGVAARM